MKASGFKIFYTKEFEYNKALTFKIQVKEESNFINDHIFVTNKLNMDLIIGGTLLFSKRLYISEVVRCLLITTD